MHLDVLLALLTRLHYNLMAITRTYGVRTGTASYRDPYCLSPYSKYRRPYLPGESIKTGNRQFSAQHGS